jgi:hypothetical protein
MAKGAIKASNGKKLDFLPKSELLRHKERAHRIPRAPFPRFSLVQAPRAPFARLAVSLAGGLSEVTAL